MQKVACIYSFKESSWISCQKIVFNLHKAYQDLGPGYELRNFNLSEDSNEIHTLDSLSTNVYQYSPDIITFLDHKPHPVAFIKELAKFYQGKKKTKIIFHIFGDFTLYYLQWSALETILKDYQVEFLVASDRQKLLIDKMLMSKDSVLCPFPVDEKDFHYANGEREEQRKKWNVTDQDIVFLFTGRLSRQKRTKTLIACFAEAFTSEPNAHLFIYGFADNIGDPFVGIYDFEAEYFRFFYSYYESLSEDLKQRIHFMGSVPNKELQSVYLGADVLVNPSVHNDEDYGMSVAEAQFQGLPSILSDWGGLASFHHPAIPEAVAFIPVKIGVRSKLLSHSILKSKLQQFFKSPLREIRPQIANCAREKFGIKRASSIILKVINKKSSTFAGFDELFKKIVVETQLREHGQMYLGKYAKLRKLYKEIYAAYVGKY